MYIRESHNTYLMTDLIHLQDILPLDNLSKEGKVLIVRHSHQNLHEMEEKGLIEEYQSFQGRTGFMDAKYLVSFLATEKGNHARFFGIYKVRGIRKGSDCPKFSDDLAYYDPGYEPGVTFHLELEKLPGFDKYRDRLIIDWMTPRGWYHNYKTTTAKVLLQILPINFVSDFPGLMNIKVSYQELEKIIHYPESHPQWRESLQHLQAIYLILDTESGNQYIGTTFGDNGLWNRWESYVRGDRTGGNIEFKALKEKDHHFYRHFQYSILEVLSKTADKHYCIAQETLWKDKLGTRAFGLNRN